MTVFKRVMTMSRPSKDVFFLGSVEDNNQSRRQMFKEYEEMRMNSEYFRGAVFSLSNDQLFLEKVEIWQDQDSYQNFIQENKDFISKLVREYEEYCNKTDIRITRRHEATLIADLTPEQKQAFDKKSFLRIFF